MPGQKFLYPLLAIAGFRREKRATDRPLVLLARLTLVQIGLLALGLWLHDHFLVAAARMESQRLRTGASAEDARLDRFPGDLDADQVTSAELVGMMPSTRWFTLAWVASLQASAAFLVYCRLWKLSTKTRSDTTELLARQERELVRTRDAIIFGLARLADSRDRDTGKHLERIASYSTRLASELRKLPYYRAQVTPAFVKLIGVSSALHDIGKVGVADAILQKPGKLTPEERTRMQVHAALGGDCIREIERQLGGARFLEMAREIAYSHHERWDGLGYPFGLSGERIPLAARIVAIADVYDALSVRRVYKAALSHDECVALILEQSGKQFDPTLVEVFVTISEEFRQIAEQFAEARDGSPQGALGEPLPASIEDDEGVQLYVVDADDQPLPTARAL